MRTRLQDDEGTQNVLETENPRSAKEYEFNQVMDRLLLQLVYTKLELHKRLTEPRVNQMLKRQWFEAMAVGDGFGLGTSQIKCN